ncbi:MAG: YkgJ family cysteine cluster protein [Deltaproteobacteria bacterium]|nr:YkgJ family cysteine cluster protein [Deltaproteobacteria bacterium]
MSRYRELTGKVDGFFARVMARHGGDMQCGAGCDDCCRTRLTITGVEAATVRAHVATLEPAARAHLAEIARRPFDATDPRCAALDADGRCLIYDGRPVVCRSHGVPIRFHGIDDAPVVDACPKNFTARGPAAADPDCILDQTTLSTALYAIERDDAQRTGRAPERVELAELLIALTES